MQASQFVDRVHARAIELVPDAIEIARLSDADPDVVELAAFLTTETAPLRVEEVARQVAHAASREHRKEWMVQTRCHGRGRPMERPMLSKAIDHSPENEHRAPLSVSHHSDAMHKLRQRQQRMRERAPIMSPSAS